MAVYKRVNTRRRRTVRNVLLWLAAILLIFGATVAFGAYLGRRAETAPAPHGFGAASDLAGETAAPIAEHIVHGEYTEPSALTAFDDGGDPYAHASLWLYKDGKSAFATETDKKLGQEVSSLPALSLLAAANTAGLFEVRSIYADAQVREVLYAYENALLDEFCASGVGEVTLVFSRLDADCLADVLDMAAARRGAVTLCVPISVLGSESCAKFFTAASENGYTVSLCAGGIGADALAQCVEDYAFYFTKYSLRLVLEGSEEALLDVLREKTLLSYQFCSARPTKEVGTP